MSQSHKPFESEASQSHLKFFKSSYDLVESQELSSQFASLIDKLNS